MHHVVVDRWSRADTFLHRRDPRAKVIATLVFLVVLATTPGNAFVALAVDFVLLTIALAIARLPIANVLLRASAVLPFCLTFALISWIVGDRERALALIEKTYLSAIAVLLLAATTPLPALIRGLDTLGAPRFLLTVVQFMYRYLFVISEQAQHMRIAAASRAGIAFKQRFSFGAAAGAVAVLFARSYHRSEGIHRAMAARGFKERFPVAQSLKFQTIDAAFTLVSVALVILTRLEWRP